MSIKPRLVGAWLLSGGEEGSLPQLLPPGVVTGSTRCLPDTDLEGETRGMLLSGKGAQTAKLLQSLPYPPVAPSKSQFLYCTVSEVPHACCQFSSQLTLTSGVSGRTLGCGKPGGTASVGMCHRVGRGQPVAVLQVPVSWMLACGVCQEQGLGFISPVI